VRSRTDTRKLAVETRKSWLLNAFQILLYLLLYSPIRCKKKKQKKNHTPATPGEKKKYQRLKDFTY